MGIFFLILASTHKHEHTLNVLVSPVFFHFSLYASIRKGTKFLNFWFWNRDSNGNTKYQTEVNNRGHLHFHLTQTETIVMTQCSKRMRLAGCLDSTNNPLKTVRFTS